VKSCPFAKPFMKQALQADAIVLGKTEEYEKRWDDCGVGAALWVGTLRCS
jgi:hypothetical protein